jgi:hypothetical protein
VKLTNEAKEITADLVRAAIIGRRTGTDPGILTCLAEDALTSCQRTGWPRW